MYDVRLILLLASFPDSCAWAAQEPGNEANIQLYVSLCVSAYSSSTILPFAIFTHYNMLHLMYITVELQGQYSRMLEDLRLTLAKQECVCMRACVHACMCVHR